ncbi:hypothetical protein, partial [Micrococcus luteus]|uniref:hypothetical protein n=1 Tax=Micrococcus luteus TaxID=1270 RepID=UPI001C92D2CB
VEARGEVDVDEEGWDVGDVRVMEEEGEGLMDVMEVVVVVRCEGLGVGEWEWLGRGEDGGLGPSGEVGEDGEGRGGPGPRGPWG